MTKQKMARSCDSSANMNESTKEIFVNMQRPGGKHLVGITEAKILILECLKCEPEIRDHCKKAFRYLQGLLQNQK